MPPSPLTRLLAAMAAKGHRCRARWHEGAIHLFLDLARALDDVPETFEAFAVVPRIMASGRKEKP
jgi:hypothetical protein